MTTATSAARVAHNVRTLPDAARVFFRHGSPLILVAASVASLVAVAVHGRWAWGQLAVVAVLVAVQPFVEWLIHVYLLHAKPRRIGSKTFDPYAARKHRAHHASPRDLEILFMPLRGHLVGAFVAAGLCVLLPTWSVRLALLVAISMQSLLYEWVHFLVHTDYKPKGRTYRRLYVGHRLHHYRNENYWFGVSRRFADTVLHTNPAKEDVPLSPTCRSLGG